MQKQFNKLIQQKKWQMAFEFIKHYAGNDEKLLHIKSLLCRFYNQYDIENKTIEYALPLFPDSPYMLERRQWHETSWFKRLSPRPSLHLPRDKKYIPKQKTLDKLCIVMAANDTYFELLVECIESIKATRFYRHIDIKILDVGLTRQAYFLDRWNIEVIAPGWPVECEFIHFFKHYFRPPYNVQANKIIDKGDYYSVPRDNIRYAQAVLNKPFLHELFSGYAYYLWIDADCWVQDERGLDKLINMAEKQGYAFPSSLVPEKSNPDLGTCRVPENWQSGFEGKPSTASSIFCNSKVFQQKWADNYRNAGEQCGFWWGQEEEVASYCMDKQPEFIEFSEVLYLYRHFGFPVVKSAENILRNPENLNIIAVFGLGLDKFRYFYPVAQYHDDKLSDNDLLNCIKAVGLDINWSKYTPSCFTDQKLVSFRYRCMPSHSDAMLEEQLEKRSYQILEQDGLLSKVQGRVIQKNDDIDWLPVVDNEKAMDPMIKSDLRFLESESISDLKTHEFIALREAQFIVKIRNEHIQQLERALQEAQGIVTEKIVQNEELDMGLQEAQRIVKEQVVQIDDLDASLQEAQGIVSEQVVQIKELDLGLQRAQKVVDEKIVQNQALDTGLQEAQRVVNEQVVQIEELDLGLQEAQRIVNEKELQNQALDTGLQEAQRVVNEQVVQIEELDLGLQEAQRIVNEKELQNQTLDKGLQEAQRVVNEQIEQIDELDLGLQGAQRIVNEKELRNQTLDKGLQEAQRIVTKKEVQNQALDKGLQEAQSIVKEQGVQIEQLDSGLKYAQNIVKQRNSQIQQLDPALQEAQHYVRKRESEIETLQAALSEAQNK